MNNSRLLSTIMHLTNFGSPNTTNDFSPMFAAHKSYVSIVSVQVCGSVMDIEDKCMFVTNVKECHAEENNINYMSLLFCDFETNLPLGIFILCIMCLYLFLILGTTADKFFCPALAVISKVLNIGENLAGVTILAFGNGSPDIFTSIANPEGDTELMYSELMGAAIFVTTVIAGCIIVINPFVLEKFSFVRDTLFFTVSILYIAECIADGKYTLTEGIGTIAIYLVYLGVVIVQHVLAKREATRIKRLSIESILIHPELENKLMELEQFTEIEFIRRHTYFESVYPEPAEGDNFVVSFLKAIIPIDLTEFKTGNIFVKFIAIIKAPIIFFLLLVVPVVDYGIEDGHGWCRLLNALHCITLPTFLMFATNSFGIELYGFSLYGLVLIVSTCLAVAVLCTSKTNEPPNYHAAFAIGSFFGSILTIYIVAGEVVSVLQTLGVVSKLSHAMLGFTVLAWGNSIGDLFANITLAKTGYTRMAFAACFGGPMFNTLLGIGVRFLIMAVNSPDHVALVREGAAGPNLTWFLMVNFIFLMAMVALTNFQARKSVGVFMLITYVVFLIFALFGEFEVIHPYGTDHIDEKNME